MNQEMWEKAKAFHGHQCPGLAIGVKACEAAIEKMGIGTSQDEELVCVTENDACGVDAVQAILGCSIGKGNLLYRDTGKQAFSFFDRKSGKSVRMYLKATSNGMERKEWQQYLLDAKIEDVFAFSVPSFQLPEFARKFTTTYCALCKEGAPEHKMRLQDGKTVCLDCFCDYKRGW